MVKPFPTEILERIISYYFKRDELLHTPEDDFSLITPTRGSTSLLLVSRAFRLLVLPSLFYSISITHPHHWELLFRWETGLLAGFEDEARTRRSWVREIRFDLNVHIPIALQPDGLTLSPSRQGTSPFSLWNPSPPLVSFSSFPTPSDNGKATPPPRFFPNLNRVVLLLPSSSAPSPPPPLPPHLLEQLIQRHLQQYRREQNDSTARFPRGLGFAGMDDSERLESLFIGSLEREKQGVVDRFLSGLYPAEMWIPVGGRGGDTSIVKLLPQHYLWEDEELDKHLVLLDPPSSSPASASAYPLLTDPNWMVVTPVHQLVMSLASFDALDLIATKVRFVAFPSDPRFRRGMWELWAKRLCFEYFFEDLLEGDERETAMLKVLKGKDWAWVEDDGREVGFEEGMSLVEGQE